MKSEVLRRVIADAALGIRFRPARNRATPRREGACFDFHLKPLQRASERLEEGCSIDGLERFWLSFAASREFQDRDLGSACPLNVVSHLRRIASRSIVNGCHGSCNRHVIAAFTF
ncbi:MAG: hypothetical protein C4326_11120 [Ignavibacteria bacterium]